MSRYFAPITIAELEAKIKAEREKAHSRYSIRELTPKIKKDFKVKVDFENFEDSKWNWSPDNPLSKINNLLGYNTLPNGLSFLGMIAGGDWEHPIFFIFYWDGNKLRAYIPTEGNPWNTSTNQAYGNNEKEDFKNARKRWPDKFSKSEDYEGGIVEELDFDPDAILADISNRIQIIGSPPRKSEKTESKKTLEERIVALTFYGTNDEAYELFQNACSFCYKLYGLGESEKAATVCKWAEGMASESKKFAIQQGIPLDEIDTENGHWGN